jgi:hypothetical protein
MPNRSPHKARLSKRVRGKPGSLQDVQRLLWYGILRTKQTLDGARKPANVLKAVHCLSQVSGQYAKLLEIGELEARLAVVEAALAAKGAVL